MGGASSTTALALVLALAAQGRPGGLPETPWPEVEVRSAGGRFVAEIAKAEGQERVRGPLARWRAAVFAVRDGGRRVPFWEELYPYAGRPRRFLLSDDGTTLVHVAEPFSSHRPVVRVHREGEEVAALTGDELGVERSALVATADGPAWLAPGEGAVRLAWRETSVGAWLGLEIDVRDGATRVVDAGTGERFHGERGPQAVRVRPAAPDDEGGRFEEPYVTAVTAPSHALAGAPLELRVEGDHPTPNWRLAGFRLERVDGAERVVELVPCTVPPAGGAQVQVLHGFRRAVLLDGLDVGRWTVVVRGRGEGPPATATVEVLPARSRASLRVTGGIAGIERRVEVFAPGVLALRSGKDARYALLPRATVRALDARLAALPSEPRSRTSSTASDLFVYELGWWTDGVWHEVRVDDGTSEGPVRDALALLGGLAEGG